MALFLDVSVPTIPLTHKATKRFVAKLQAKQESSDPQMFQVHFLYWIFSKSSFMFS
jgi:hypothetical protein